MVIICREFKYVQHYYWLTTRCNPGTQIKGRAYSLRVEGAKYGVSFGSALAITISYTANHSVLWAIIDGILSWLYVIYFALFRA